MIEKQASRKVTDFANIKIQKLLKAQLETCLMLISVVELYVLALPLENKLTKV